MSAMFLSPGKALTDPLLILLLVMMTCVVLARRRARADRALRRLLNLTLATLIALWMLSLHIVTFALVRTLTSDSVQDGEIDVIAVAGSGSLRELEVLNATSSSRVATAVAWWQMHPAARLVMCGLDTGPGGMSQQTAELMRERAVRLGVPRSSIMLETRSTNTREHPMRLRELPGITRATRVGVVTSSWHMRRTRREFAKHFDRVIPRADDPPELGAFIVNDFIPSSIALRDSTRLVHEWIGLAWYALRP